MSTMTRTARWLAPAFAVGLVLAGCSKDADTTATSGSPSGSTAPASPTTTATTSGGTYGSGGDTDDSTTAPAGTSPGTSAVATSGAGAFKVATTPIGSIVADSGGMTVYAFKKDTPTTSACNAGCDTAWPPVVAGTVTAGPGLDSASFTTLTRSDGTKQVVYKGHPLYHFAADTKAGDVAGQGVGGNWYVIGADGSTIETKAP